MPSVDAIVVAPLRGEPGVAVVLRRRGISDVADDRCWLEPDLPAFACRAPTPLEVLGVHEQPFVETAELLDSRTPKQERGTMRPVNLACRHVVGDGRAVQRQLQRESR